MTRRRIGGGSTGILDGELAPGDDVEPPSWIDPRAFTIDVLDPRGRVVSSGVGPLLSMDVPVPPLALGGGGAIGPLAVTDTWTVRVTNNSSWDAYVAVEVRFFGQRPILSKPFEIDFINDRFDALFNSVQPIHIRFENRQSIPGATGVAALLQETWFVVDSEASWELAHPVLQDLKFSLGAEVLTEVTETTEISLRAVVHDGAPAVRARVRFLRNAGVIDVLNLVSTWSSGLADVGDLIVSLTPVDRPTVSIEQLELDVFFVLRPDPADSLGTFRLIAQPTIDLDSPILGTIGRILAQAVFEIALPDFLGGRLDDYAEMFATWLLGDRKRQLAGGDEHLDIHYVGDAPAVDLIAPTGGVSPTAVPLDPGNLAKIDHIVVIMMENRSFDNMLGYLSLPARAAGDVVGSGRNDVDGLTGTERNMSGLLDNQSREVFPLSRPWNGPAVPQELRTRPTRFIPDPGHSYADTLVQRGGFDVELRPSRVVEPGEPPEPAIVVHFGENGGFVYNFTERLRAHSEDPISVSLLRELAGEVMGYHPASHVPIYDFLAQNYAVCDRWFASHPGHTWPNRFVSLTGRLAVGPDGRPQVDNPDFAVFDPVETPTIVDHLLRAGVSCHYYEHDFCMLRVFSRYTFDDEVIIPVDDPGRGFFAATSAGNLPQVSFLEPDLTGINVGNDDHPPADISEGQRFIRRVYEALANGPTKQWESTLLLITYDEHGGFFDHVYPAEQQPLFDSSAPLAGGFVPIAFEPGTTRPVTHYGMRVPAFVVSPWVREASVSSTVYDHTSILNTIIARFLAANPPDMGWRVAHATHVGALLSRLTPQRPIVPPADPPAVQPLLLRPRRSPLAVAEPGDREFREFIRGFRGRVLGSSP